MSGAVGPGEPEGRVDQPGIGGLPARWGELKRQHDPRGELAAQAHPDQHEGRDVHAGAPQYGAVSAKAAA